jgi:two-component system sensor histidine kinase PhoQ
MRPLSLRARQLFALGLGLVACLGLTGYALERAFRDTALSNLQTRLHQYANDYIGDIEFTDQGVFMPPPEQLQPDTRFSLTGSGLYAQVRGSDWRWDSASSAGQSLPDPPPFQPGLVQFEGPLFYMHADGSLRQAYRLSHSIVWETGQVGGWHEVARFTLSVTEDVGEIDRQVQVFRRAMWSYFALAGGLLLAILLLALRWSLSPVRALERELVRVQRGERALLTRRQPRELEPLAGSVNALIENERGHLERTRNTLADLAHSLKTPLAVLRAQLDSDGESTALRGEVRTQVQRMSELVSYQLARAARSGHALYAAPLPIEPHAEDIVSSLEKVYQPRGVICEFEIDPAARFRGEVGDLQELLGNLLENAFKWARSRVLLRVAAEARGGLQVTVEDDGPGIPPEQIERLLQRGVRGDERVQGHGIGLAIVQDIVRAYRGELQVDRAPELGGARFVARFPFAT